MVTEKRIKDILLIDDLKYANTKTFQQKVKEHNLKKDAVVYFKDFNGFWPEVEEKKKLSKLEEPKKINYLPVLTNINFEILEGQLVAVIGEVGSGKSSLFCTILSEMEKYEGSFGATGKLAYVE